MGTERVRPRRKWSFAWNKMENCLSCLKSASVSQSLQPQASADTSNNLGSPPRAPAPRARGEQPVTRGPSARPSSPGSRRVSRAARGTAAASRRAAARTRSPARRRNTQAVPTDPSREHPWTLSKQGALGGSCGDPLAVLLLRSPRSAVSGTAALPQTRPRGQQRAAGQAARGVRGGARGHASSSWGGYEPLPPSPHHSLT